MSWSGAWPSQDLQTSRNRLINLKTLIESQKANDPDIVAELSRLLVIRATGYVEFTFDTAIAAFADAHSNPVVARHVRASLFQGRNPWPNVLLDRAKILAPEWEESLKSFLDANDNLIRQELTFMVDRRNKIAHGQNESVNRRKALDLAELSLKLGDFIVYLIDPR